MDGVGGSGYGSQMEVVTGTCWTPLVEAGQWSFGVSLCIILLLLLPTLVLKQVTRARSQT